MKPITLAVVTAALLAGACGPKAQPTKPGDGSASAPLIAKKIQLSWGISQGAKTADVFLQSTDETGAQISHPLGTFDGQCKPITPAPEMTAVLGVACINGATGIELDVTATNGHIIVMRAHTQQGIVPDPMSRDELTRFDAPPGAAVEAKP